MEEGKSGVTADSREIVTVRDDEKVSLQISSKKKRGALHLLRAAMFMLRRRKKSKPLHAEVTSSEVLNKVVGSMPPLEATLVPALSLSTQDLFLDVPPSPDSVLIPPSPNHSSTASEGATSQSASWLNLQELDKIDNHEKTDNCQDNEFGDELIARLYDQMRIQNQNDMDRPTRPHYDRQPDSTVRDG